jgi:hypothetical protein
MCHLAICPLLTDVPYWSWRITQLLEVIFMNIVSVCKLSITQLEVSVCKLFGYAWIHVRPGMQLLHLLVEWATIGITSSCVCTLKIEHLF